MKLIDAQYGKPYLLLPNSYLNISKSDFTKCNGRQTILKMSNVIIKISDSANDVLILDSIPQQFPFSLKEKKS